MKKRHQRNTTCHIRQYSLSVTMDYAIDTGIHAKYFAVDETFGVAFLCLLFDLESIIHSQQRVLNFNNSLTGIRMGIAPVQNP